MPYQIVRNDIVKMRVDAIVNPTDSWYSGSGGTDERIHRFAGKEMDRVLASYPPIDEGMVAVTEGFGLPCRFVIHTIGPIWEGGDHHERETLVSCYRNALSAAEERRCGSIAFPLISSGTFGYPKDQVLRVALETITEFLMEHDMTVFIVVYDKESYSISKKLQTDIDSFIDENYINEYSEFDEESRRRRRRGAVSADAILESFRNSARKAFSEARSTEADTEPEFSPAPKQAGSGSEESVFIETHELPSPSVFYQPAGRKTEAKKAETLDERLRKMDEPFSVCLLRLIDEKGMTDVQCYKKANVDKKLFSKMRNPTYRPSKPTVLAFAFALELTLDEAKALLEKAGFALSPNFMFDVVIQYFFEHGNYDLMEINETLYQYDLPCLGNVIA